MNINYLTNPYSLKLLDGNWLPGCKVTVRTSDGRTYLETVFDDLDGNYYILIDNTKYFLEDCDNR